MSQPQRSEGLEGDGFPSFHCFGCSPDNPAGLHLKFERTDTGAVADVRLGRNYESFPGTIHGGVIAAVLDESMGRAIFADLARPGVTLSLRTRFVEPVRVDALHRVRGIVVSVEDDLVRARAELLSSDGLLIAAADALFKIVDAAHFDVEPAVVARTHGRIGGER